MNNKENIKAAAIRKNDGTIITGRDHSQIIQSSSYGNCKKRSEEGFITNFNRFVDRKEASIIAYNAGQIKGLEVGDILISEELWFYGNYKYNEDKGYYIEGKEG